MRILEKERYLGDEEMERVTVVERGSLFSYRCQPEVSSYTPWKRSSGKSAEWALCAIQVEVIDLSVPSEVGYSFNNLVRRQTAGDTEMANHLMQAVHLIWICHIRFRSE